MLTNTQEQDLVHALRTLPVAVIITSRDNGTTYLWQCLDGNGSSLTLAEAMAAGLTYLTRTLAGDALVLDDLLVATSTSTSRMN